MMKLAGAMPGVGPAAVQEIPEVKEAVRFRVDRKARITVDDQNFTESNFFFADSNVFNVFTFPMLIGNQETDLNSPSSIVISKKIAEKYFGDKNPIGKNLIYDNKYNFTITGVFETPPLNTHLRCDFIAPYSRTVEIQNINLPWNRWGEDYTYLLLKDNASPDGLNKKLTQLLAKNTNEKFASMLQFYVIPFSDIYLKSDMMGELGPTGNLTSIYLFSTIALLLLIIACLNFVNLSTARSLRRSREVGLRKVLGAQRFGLVRQFFGESLLIVLVALAISMLLFELIHPLLYNYFNIQIVGSPFKSQNFYLILFGILFFVSFLAGIYPSVFLSKYKPVDSLKGLSNTPGTSAGGLRTVLVVFQFAITAFLIIGSFAIFKQLSFMQNSDLGFNKQNVLIVSYPINDDGMKEKYTVVKNAFQSIPGVKDVSGAYTLPGIQNKEQTSVKLKGMQDDEYAMMQAIGVDFNYLQILGIKLKEGRNFSELFPTDEENSVIINEAAVKSLRLKNPVGTEIYIPSGVVNETKPVIIIGVIKDFHVASFHNKIEPLFLYMNHDSYYNIALRYNAKNTDKIVSSLQSEWLNIFPDKEFSYSFLDNTYNSLYDSDEKTGSLFSIFSFLSILVVSLGLFGLASYSIELRIKEIGIRKVLGAGISNISLLLSKNFIKWVVVANIVAFPVAYFAISKWMEEFAYKADIGFIYYIQAALLTLAVSLIAVAFQTVKTALTNPVKTLRYE